jgi:hypothetical protein
VTWCVFQLPIFVLPVSDGDRYFVNRVSSLEQVRRGMQQDFQTTSSGGDHSLDLATQSEAVKSAQLDPTLPEKRYQRAEMRVRRLGHLQKF